MNDKEKINKLVPIEPEKYANIDLDHLALYAVAKLKQIGAELSFENAVVATFKLFPEKFSLLGFASYPDAKRVHDCLFRCTFKSKQWLGGKTRQGFVITERSRIFIKESEELLKGTTIKKTKAPSRTRRKEAIMSEVESSIAYSKYKRGEQESISEAEICFALQGTMDSSSDALRLNLASLIKYADELKQIEIGDFLKWTEQHFKQRLAPS